MKNVKNSYETQNIRNKGLVGTEAGLKRFFRIYLCTQWVIIYFTVEESYILQVHYKGPKSKT